MSKAISMIISETELRGHKNRVMKTKWGLGNGSVSKVFLMQVWRPEFGTQIKSDVALCVCNHRIPWRNGRQRQETAQKLMGQLT